MYFTADEIKLCLFLCRRMDNVLFLPYISCWAFQMYCFCFQCYCMAILWTSCILQTPLAVTVGPGPQRGRNLLRLSSCSNVRGSAVCFSVYSCVVVAQRMGHRTCNPVVMGSNSQSAHGCVTTTGKLFNCRVLWRFVGSLTASLSVCLSVSVSLSLSLSLSLSQLTAIFQVDLG